MAGQKETTSLVGTRVTLSNLGETIARLHQKAMKLTDTNVETQTAVGTLNSAINRLSAR